jgi:hypothetical protein
MNDCWAKANLSADGNVPLKLSRKPKSAGDSVVLLMFFGLGYACDQPYLCSS